MNLIFNLFRHFFLRNLWVTWKIHWLYQNDEKACPSDPVGPESETSRQKQAICSIGRTRPPPNCISKKLTEDSTKNSPSSPPPSSFRHSLKLSWKLQSRNPLSYIIITAPPLLRPTEVSDPWRKSQPPNELMNWEAGLCRAEEEKQIAMNTPPSLLLLPLLLLSCWLSSWPNSCLIANSRHLLLFN